MPLITLPVAETFHSLQGEGLYAGTPMHFLRLAGCCVGERQNASASPVPLLRTNRPAWLCHTYDGRPFWCDTDFHKYSETTVDEFINLTSERHICLTGGEPLIHTTQVGHLVRAAHEARKKLHVETSGTVRWSKPAGVWMTLSPKKGVLEEQVWQADELKLLVDEHFDEKNIPSFIKEHKLVYVQPVNEELKINRKNLELCYLLLGQHPEWRLSMQIHKVLGVR